MHSHSTPAMRPSLRRPILSRISVSGRPRCVMKVSSRLTTRRTQPPALRASSAAISSTLSVSVRQPKPPPTCGLMTRMRDMSMSRICDSIRCAVGHLRAGVHGHAVFDAIIFRDGGVHLHLVLAHLGAKIVLFADEVGLGEPF